MADVIGWFADTTHTAQGWRDADLGTGRAGDVDVEIADEPTSITLVRAGVAQDAQTVRLLQPAREESATEAGSPGGEQVEADLVVLGASAFDVARGDTFKVGAQFYEIFYIRPGQSNRVEALARQMQ